MKKFLLSALFLMFLGILQAAEVENPTRLLRFPAAHNEQLVFSYAGDLYTVSLEGGTARRLTSNPDSYEIFPRFSPDGSTIAFTANYDGNTEVYAIPAKGGTPKRLTTTATLSRDEISDRMGPNNIVMAWTPDGKNVVYRSRKQTFNDFIGHLFTVPADGGMSTQMPLPEGAWISFAPDGKRFAYNRVFREFRTWKYYKGGMADDIWIHEPKSKKTINITNNPAQDIFPMWFGDEIFFVSDRDRTANLFVYNTKTKQTSKLTNFDQYDIKFPSAATNGIVFENGGDIYHFDLSTRTAKKISIEILDDKLLPRVVRKNVSRELTAIDIAPDASKVAIAAHGEIFVTPTKKGITRNISNSSGVHERDVHWSPDGKLLAFVSDKSGEFEIHLQSPDGTNEQQLTFNSPSYIFDIAWSPDSKKILFSDKLLRLQYIDIETKKITLVAQSDSWEYTQFKWSPDSRYIVFVDNGRDISQLFLYDCKTKKTAEVTDKWFAATQPTFSPDGKYLYFASARNFSPQYTSIEWNFFYNNMYSIYAIALQKDVPQLFAPESHNPSHLDKTPEKSTDNSKNPVIIEEIDTENLPARIFPLGIKAADYYYNLNATENYLYYCRGNSIFALDLKTQEESTLASNAWYTLTQDSKKMLVSKGGSYYVINTPSSAISLTDAIPLNNLYTNINYQEEWKQIYTEAWRQMRDFFYVENMHGVNWKKMHDKYAILLPYARTKEDVNYLIGELIGELNVGHAYINGGDCIRPKRIETGLLGAQISKHSSGFFVIDSVLEGAAHSSTLRSPLAELSVNAKAGEFITAINGQSLKDVNDIYSCLVGLANTPVEIAFNKKAQLEGSRTAVVTPIASESELYYYNWVQKNIKTVEKLSDGRVGYIHIPDMGPDGLNEFVKHFYPQLDKQALIIDDRGNGGGNVSPIILERLLREPTRANMLRNAKTPTNTPTKLFLGPTVLLVSKYSASDGDLFPWGYKKHKLGKVIGTRTWGGVVGIRGSLPFVDGTDLRKPEFTSYSLEDGQYIIEGHGVEPDIYIDNDPSREFSGIDDQLLKAIEVILEELKTKSRKLPPIPADPDKSR